MQRLTDQVQEPGSSSQIPYFVTLLRDMDPKIGGLMSIYRFGLPAVQAVMLGLSRPFDATAEGASSLIDEWVRRDKNCCYQGSVQDLLSLKGTFIVAISYRHAEDRTEVSRKGPNRVCKFRPCDEELFISAVQTFGKQFSRIMVWCDQILSTKLKYEGTNFRWHLIGLLPYMAFALLHLSIHIPKEELEKRVWIRAERSLGRMAVGFIEPDQANRLIQRPGKCLHGWECMKNACKHILSGYWPEEHGYWEEDFELMRKWALGVLCRSGPNYSDVPLLQEHDKLDNTEILSNFGEFATMPFRMNRVEPFIMTEDKLFFLKVTAWNLHVTSIWEQNTRYISHYMGLVEDTRFSWWRCEKAKILFGCMIYRGNTPTIIATETNTGYKVFRGMGDRLLYIHAERIAGPSTKKQIQNSAKKVGIDLPDDLDWRLLYCSDNRGLTDVRSVQEVLSEVEGQPFKAEVLVAPVFRGTTTKLFECAVAKGDGDPREIGRRISQCCTEWNNHVRNAYKEWMTVRDTSLGAVWLEGFDEDHLSFGFLDFLTNALVLNRRDVPDYSVKLVDPRDVGKEVLDLSIGAGQNERCFAAEFFSDEEENMTQTSRRDLVRYILCGGFGKKFEPLGLFAFLTSLARSRKYWVTMTVCRDGVMQIRFGNAEGEKRIAQRRSSLQNYTAYGIVHPDDYEEVENISTHYDTSADDKHTMLVYWNETVEDTTTREEMWRVLKNSRRAFERQEVLLTDMTVGKNEEDYLSGKGNMYRHKHDPHRSMEMVVSGRVEEDFVRWEEMDAVVRITGDKLAEKLQEKIALLD